MILFVDETESDDLFIVAGLLVNSKQDAEMVFKRFKKKAQRSHLSQKSKARLFNEFKSTIMDKEYINFKREMLLELSKLDYTILFSTHRKQNILFKQREKETAYIRLLSRITEMIVFPVEIIFDSFNLHSFEERIVKRISGFENVLSVHPERSETQPGIILVDNICSVIKRHLKSDDSEGLFSIIKATVKRI